MNGLKVTEKEPEGNPAAGYWTALPAGRENPLLCAPSGWNVQGLQDQWGRSKAALRGSW